MKIHNLGYPRIGAKRELKFGLEKYWRGEKTAAELLELAKEIRQQNWQTQLDAGIELLPVNDFAYYDQMLNMSTLLGVIPTRFRQDTYDLEVSFRMARGRAPSDDGHGCGCNTSKKGSKADYAGDMKKWFDTNYHYIVPEFEEDTKFKITDTRLFEELAEAKNLTDVKNLKPVLIGPLTYLYLGKEVSGNKRLNLLPSLLKTYVQVLQKLADAGVEWVQIDEPILVLELEDEWQQAFKDAYSTLTTPSLKILIATYFDTLGENLSLVNSLPVAGLHYDAVRGEAQLQTVINEVDASKVLSLGLVEGRNIWIADYNKVIKKALPAVKKFKDNLWIAPACSLLHSPVDLDLEEKLDDELKFYLAFAKQKLTELSVIADALQGVTESTELTKELTKTLSKNSQIIKQRNNSNFVNNASVQEKIKNIASIALDRDNDYATRAVVQKTKYNLPLFPTTTIGSFPQTVEIRAARRQFKNAEITETDYRQKMQAEIIDVVERQERIGIDVLVHGEPERNDMVEYFGEKLDGYAFTQFGWVQSYGSRCVKPPIIFGDVSRPKPMTVEWSQFAQAQTKGIMKGMLTGAVTMLQWSFVRDDQPRETTCNQIALALRDEVLDLEAAGIEMIQIDEAALREGLPLKKSQWQAYLIWAVNSFRLTTSGVKDTSQIHTHMCYSEFNDIIEAVAKMDADVITIETSKSHMKLLQAFVDFEYPNEIGPGVYDIHSPNIPTVEQMVSLIEKAVKNIPAQRLWVNPDCGLKTRNWVETEPALINMVKAAKQLRCVQALAGFRY